MKKKQLIVGLGLALLGAFAHAQNGLKSITVEKYYVSNAADAAAADVDASNAGYPTGVLPVGSVTYRIYADMLAGYNFQALYGVPTHTLVLTTSTNFYNNSAGSSNPGWNRTAVKNTTGNVLGLDSYFSVGAAASNAYGIPKADDVVATGGANLITLVAGNVLQNADASAGIPLTTQDGYYYSGAPSGLPAPGAASFTPGLDVSMLNDGSVVGNSFLTTNGSIYIAGGSTGPIPSTNRVLIAQITTNGVFHYELNLQIGGAGGSVQNFVASNPVGAEISIPSLHGTLGAVNTPPSVSLTSPANGANLVASSSVTVTATASDLEGTVASVQFFVDGVSIGTDATSPYSATWASATPVGTHTITATATDNDGASASDSHVVNVVSNPPPVVTITSPSTGSTAIVPDVVPITATATDNGSVVSVEFFDGATSLGVDNTAPYSANWTSTLGVHTLSAKATDNLGAQSTYTISVTGITNPLPSVSITSPAGGSSFFAPAVVHIAAAASDNETVTSVEFFVNGVSIGVDNTAPYTMDWTSVVGSAHLTAKATDNRGGQTTSAVVTIDIQDANKNYKVGTITTTCLPSGFCLPVVATYTVQGGVIGYDIVLHYNKAKVTPDTLGSSFTTAKITKSSDLLAASKFDVVNYIDTANANINITAYINSTASASDNFHGLPGSQLFCVAFSKKAAFQPMDEAAFTATLTETFYTTQSVKQVADGKYSTYQDTIFNGNLVSWSNGHPIKYDARENHTADYLITNITNCAGTSAAVNPDTLGAFHYNIRNGLSVNIKKDIAASTSVFSVVSGYDQLLTAKTAIGDPSFVPTIYQFIAMDVNQDQKVTSSDIAQIGQRSVGHIDQFTQVAGTPQRDWSFVSPDLLATPAYQPGGYSKSNVPNVPSCLAVPVTNVTACPLIGTATYTGVLLGDVDGNYSPDAKGTNLKLTSDKVVFDMSNAVIKDGYIDIPVSVESRNAVNSLDFTMQFNNGNLRYNSIVNHDKLQTSDRFDPVDNVLRVASYSLEKYDINKAVVSVRFAILNGNADVSDLTSLTAYVNGKASQVATKGSVSTLGTNNVSVYPNPTTGTLFVQAAEESIVQLFDMNGKVIMETHVNANEMQTMNVQDIASGVYMMRIYNDASVSTQKVVINK